MPQQVNSAKKGGNLWHKSISVCMKQRERGGGEEREGQLESLQQFNDNSKCLSKLDSCIITGR